MFWKLDSTLRVELPLRILDSSTGGITFKLFFLCVESPEKEGNQYVPKCLLLSDLRTQPFHSFLEIFFQFRPRQASKC